MRNVILGVIAVVWGLAIIVNGLGGPNSDVGGAYGAGRSAAMVVAAVMVFFGARALVRAARDRAST